MKSNYTKPESKEKEQNKMLFVKWLKKYLLSEIAQIVFLEWMTNVICEVAQIVFVKWMTNVIYELAQIVFLSEWQMLFVKWPTNAVC